MDDGTAQTNPLAVLGAHLGARGFTVELLAHGLRVVNEQVGGGGEDDRHPADTITCRPRDTDGGRMWFWTLWGEPIAEADHIIDASVIVMGNLSGRSTGTRR